jgi:hypothetical protein
MTARAVVGSAMHADADQRPPWRRLPDGTRSVQSPFVWRLFVFMSLVAFGLCITFAAGGRLFYAASWGVITAGWFGIGMWLWRKHLRDDDAAAAGSRDASRPRRR